MIIERNFARFVVFKEDSILTALNKINANQARVIYAVSESGILEGILTDGDFRRWVTSKASINLNMPVESIVNKNFKRANIDAEPNEIMAIFSKNLTNDIIYLFNRILHYFLGVNSINGIIISSNDIPPC